jgi:hypothetical protein
LESGFHRPQFHHFLVLVADTQQIAGREAIPATSMLLLSEPAIERRFAVLATDRVAGALANQGYG